MIKDAMKLAQSVFIDLDKHWHGINSGVWRPSYSHEESEAISIIAAESTRLGMASYMDPAGNAYFIYPGRRRNAPVFMTGSHLDAAPNGGRWDGMAGIVAGISAIKLLREKNVIPEQDVVIAAFRGEESAWFNQALLGSGFACGMVGADSLENTRKDTAETLSYHMSDIGINVNSLRKLLDSRTTLLPLKQIGVFLETHIEQSYSLQKGCQDIGIVTGIRGNVRCPEMISFYGEAAHTGATLQADRKDASLAAAYYQVALDQKFKEIEKGADIVWAITEGNVVDASPTTVSRQYNIRPEVRSLDMGVLLSVKDIFCDLAEDVAQKRGVIADARANHIVVSEPVILSFDFQRSIYDAALSLGYNAKRLPSGAGHDAANFAKVGVKTGMIFIPHGNNGISHNPNEIMAASDDEDPFSVGGAFSRSVYVMSKLMTSCGAGNFDRRLGFESCLRAIGAREIG